MTCSLSDAQLVFERSGMIIAPYDLDYRSRRDRLDWAKARISRTAGEYIGDNSLEHEPVRIEVDGHVIRRLMLPDSPVELGVEDAHLTLVDPLHILERGIVDKVFPRTTLRDVSEYIFEQRDDPNRVLEDVRITDPQLGGVVTESYEARYPLWYAWVETTGLVTGSRQIYDRLDIAGNTLRLLDEFTEIVDREGGFDFDGISPKEALALVGKEFNVQAWVDDDGILWIGMPDVRADFFMAGGPAPLKIKSYNVTEDAIPVSGVKVSGTYTLVTSGPYFGGPTSTFDETKLQSWAVARRRNRSNGRMITLDTKQVMKGEDLANIAVTRLRAEIHDSKSGSIVLNPLASDEEQGHPTEISVGDHIGAFGNIEQDCKQTFDSDLFVVNGVHHRIGDDVGWEITVNVGKLADPGDIEVDFWYFDPTSQEVLEPEEVYKMNIDPD